MGLMLVELYVDENEYIDLDSIANQVKHISGLNLIIDVVDDKITFIYNKVKVCDCSFARIDSKKIELYLMVLSNPYWHYLTCVIFGVFKDIGAKGIDEHECIRESWVIFKKKMDESKFSLLKQLLKWFKFV